MSKVVSNKSQLEKLVSLMEANPLVAKGISSKIQSTKKWEEFTLELNCLGPLVRTTAKWIKVWADMKSKTKKKLSQNKSEYRATGGGPNSLHVFTNIEEAIIGLFEFEAWINPPGADVGLGITCEDQRPGLDEEALDKENASNPSQHPEENLQTCYEDQNVIVSEIRTRKEKGKNGNKTERLKLLEMQTNSQQSYHEKMLSIMRDIKKCAQKTEEYTRKMYYLKKDSSKELLELKREKLILYKKKLNPERKY